MTKNSILSVDEMTQAGVNFGHKVSKLHPKMKQFVSGIKNNVHMFDLEKTAKELERALNFIEKIIADNKVLLFVGTKPQLKGLITQTAKDVGLPYVTERWLGGTITNFETIQKRVDYFKDLERKKMTGELEKYTKKERLMFDKELAKLQVKFGGIKNMSKLPDAVFIFGLDKDMTAAKEAKKKGIKIVAIVDSNINPDIADYAIPANDDAMSAVKYILDRTSETIKNAKK